MAYMTYYNMEISETEPTIEELASKLTETLDKQTPHHPMYPTSLLFWENVLGGEVDASWHDHQESMQAISPTWPNVLFSLSGKGEDQDDQWVEYHINGKVQCLKRPDWEPEPFDPTKLE